MTAPVLPTLPQGAPVAAQPAAPPSVGLIQSARTTLDAEAGWERGLVYAPESCGGYIGFSDCSASSVDQRRDRPGLVGYQPWTLFVEEECSTLGYEQAAADARLRRQLAAVESYAIARELLLGELTRAEVAAGAYEQPNPYLTDPGRLTDLTPGGGPTSTRRALGLLEEALGHALTGQVAYIHAPAAASQHMLTAGVRVNGNLRQTFRDNQVVIEAGYAAAAPGGGLAAAGEAWLYGTGLTVVRRGPVFADTEDLGQLIDRGSNRVAYRVGRRVAAHYDPCAQFAVHVALD